MKLLLAAVVLIASVCANPIIDRGHQARQNTGNSISEFTSNGCNDIIMFFARGTDQTGNIGDMPGPDLVDGVKSAFGRRFVNVEGVKYGANIWTNALPGGCDPIEAAAMAGVITQAATNCPNAQIIVSGYSQGAAMVHRSIQMLPESIKDRIAAAVTFGDTQTLQDGGRIQTFDVAKTLILCNDGDLVCEGTLIVTDAHRNYNPRVSSAVDFIESRVGFF